MRLSRRGGECQSAHPQKKSSFNPESVQVGPREPMDRSSSTEEIGQPASAPRVAPKSDEDERAQPHSDLEEPRIQKRHGTSPHRDPPTKSCAANRPRPKRKNQWRTE